MQIRSLPYDSNFAEKLRIKRVGKDKNDTYWQTEKIHGLEDIVFATPDESDATGEDLMKIQYFLDKINDSGKPLPH